MRKQLYYLLAIQGTLCFLLSSQLSAENLTYRDAERLFPQAELQEKYALPSSPSILRFAFHTKNGDRKSSSSTCMIDGKWKLEFHHLKGDKKLSIKLPNGKSGEWELGDRSQAESILCDLALDFISEREASLSLWLDGDLIFRDEALVDNQNGAAIYGELVRPKENDGSQTLVTLDRSQSRKLNMDGDFTAFARFSTKTGGTLFAKAPSKGKWAPNGKTVFVSGEHVTFDIGWLGAMRGRAPYSLTNGKSHSVALKKNGNQTTLFIDGKSVAVEKDFSRPDNRNHVFKIGNTSSDFPDDGGAFEGIIHQVAFFNSAQSSSAITQLHKNEKDISNAAYHFQSQKKVKTTQEDPETQGHYIAFQQIAQNLVPTDGWVQKAGTADHAGLIQSLNKDSIKRGSRIYQGLCFACHGTPEKKGSLPTSRPFWSDPFKNGNDPYSLYLTMKNGYEQMPPQPWLTPSQAYDVIHYIREEFVKKQNPDQYFEITDKYLTGLPKGTGDGTLTKEQIDFARGPKYLRMNFGPMLNWTFQVAPGNIAYKGIAIRLDDGPGGVSKGNSWLVYDHDTMRVAAAWTGNEFVDWRGIAFDQSHGTHTSIKGAISYVNPVGPGWARPHDHSWDDNRFRGRDNKPYGPLAKDWVHFKGQYIHGNKVVIDYTVGDARVLETPDIVSQQPSPIYSRTLNIGKSSFDMSMRIAPENINVLVAAQDGVSLDEKDGFHYLNISKSATPLKVEVIHGDADQQALFIAGLARGEAQDLSELTHGGPTQWQEVVETKGIPGGDSKPFEADEIAYPEDNPWHSWMRIGGFDFLTEDKAIVATWLGDVWLVDGIKDINEGSTHHWKRICTGLFQPLGVKYHNNKIYITCRDQIAILHDLNGDLEIDHIQSFNNDHQVTEHFHEFAMGLQVDGKGNFYYAKSARHAKTALVAHHGTLLRVTPDGSRTDILATGFRAANGVCINPDGTFIVTDQEGHWNPKNRINYVKEGGFYGNMYGYHDVTDSSDEAMEQPLCWITNAFDRSPGELLWVPENASWGNLNGRLLNLSYGTGKVFLVPHEVLDGQAQGGMISLGLEFPTGIMRGRFHPGNGQLYATGMFAWAGNKHRDGGFYKIRRTNVPANLPVTLQADSKGINMKFTNKLDKQFVEQVSNYKIKTWDLIRTRNYGSPHRNQKSLDVKKVTLLNDERTLRLEVPEIQKTWGMEIKMKFKSPDGEVTEKVLHNTIHQLNNANVSF